MSRSIFAILVISIVVIILIAMWIGWRSRARRDAGVIGDTSAPNGELIASFGGSSDPVQFVSTTPAGEPLARVAAPGMRYRGPAEITVRQDGVTIQVAGERAVHLAATQILGGGSASRRAGKAVEAGGLALLRWRSGERELESSFRFAERDAHARFEHAIEQISGRQGPADQTQDDQEGTR